MIIIVSRLDDDRCLGDAIGAHRSAASATSRVSRHQYGEHTHTHTFTHEWLACCDTVAFVHYFCSLAPECVVECSLRDTRQLAASVRPSIHPSIQCHGVCDEPITYARTHARRRVLNASFAPTRLPELRPGCVPCPYGREQSASAGWQRSSSRSQKERH